MFFLDRKDFEKELTPQLMELYQIIQNDLKEQIFLLPHTNLLES